MKILIDTNIASDVLLQRQPFYSDAIKIFALSKGGIELFISASAITDIYYITSREKKSRDIAITLLEQLLLNICAASVTDAEIRRAINLKWKDFEDAVQFASGESLQVDYIVTRNTKDFSSSTISVITPENLVKMLTVP